MDSPSSLLSTRATVSGDEAVLSGKEKRNSTEELEGLDVFHFASGLSTKQSLSDRPVIDPDELTLCEVVGSGATAEVYRGTYRDKTVAVKRFTDPKAAQDKYINREVEALSRLKHPNIVRLYGLCHGGDGFQLVAEFSKGGTLFDLMHVSDTELVFGQQMKMGADVAQGMDYLHTRSPPIIHRDLKSLNLLLKEVVSGVSTVPNVQVADFGMSRMTAKDSAMTRCVGTMQWMAPECISTDLYDQTVDIYSYGICLYEIMAREPPYFELDDATKIEDYVVKGGRPDLEAIPLDTPKPLLQLMEQCWGGDRKRRPPFSKILQRLHEVEPQIANVQKAQTPAAPMPQKGDAAKIRRRAYYTRKGYTSKQIASQPHNVQKL